MPAQRLLEDQDLFQYNLLRAGTRAKCLWAAKQQSSCGYATVIRGGRMQVTDKRRRVKVTPRTTLQAPTLPHLPISCVIGSCPGSKVNLSSQPLSTEGQEVNGKQIAGLSSKR